MMPASPTATWCAVLHSPEAQISQCDDQQGLLALLLTLAEQTDHQLDLLLHQTETRLFDQPPFLAHIRRLCIGHHRNQVRLCIHDVERMGSDCPRLLDLCQRMPSRCQIRTPNIQHRDIGYDFIIADQRHLLYRRRPHRYEAQLNLHDPLNARGRHHEFEAIWALAGAAQGLRRLDL